MNKKRTIILDIPGIGIGNDGTGKKFNQKGINSLKDISNNVCFDIPNLKKLGLSNISKLSQHHGISNKNPIGQSFKIKLINQSLSKEKNINEIFKKNIFIETKNGLEEIDKYFDNNSENDLKIRILDIVQEKDFDKKVNILNKIDLKIFKFISILQNDDKLVITSSYSIKNEEITREYLPLLIFQKNIKYKKSNEIIGSKKANELITF